MVNLLSTAPGKRTLYCNQALNSNGEKVFLTDLSLDAGRLSSSVRGQGETIVCRTAAVDSGISSWEPLDTLKTWHCWSKFMLRDQRYNG